MIISCAFPEYGFQTEDFDRNISSAALQSHAFCYAFPPNAHRIYAAVAPEAPRHNGPKLDRPGIDVGVSLQEWNVFTGRWDDFKQGSVINAQSASAQLFQCASQTLGDQMLKTDANIASMPIGDVLKAMQRLAVIPVATGVLQSELMITRQDRDEQLRSFTARVRSKTDTCSFSATCSCGIKVDYTDHMICATLQSGILDDEIRRDVIRIDGKLTRLINDITALAESKEMARNAVPTRNIATLSGFKLNHATCQVLAGRKNFISSKLFNDHCRPPNVSQKYRCSQYDKLFSLYK